MNSKAFRKGCAVVLAVYVVVVALYALIAGDRLKYKYEMTAAVNASAITGEIVQGTEVRQPFEAAGEELLSVTMQLSTFGRENTSHLRVSVVDETGAVLGMAEVSASELKDNAAREFVFAEPIALTEGHSYALVLESPDAVAGNAVTAWYGNTMSATRAEVAVEIREGEQLLIDGVPQDGKLNLQMQVRSPQRLGQYYWWAALILGALLLLCMLRLLGAVKYNRKNYLLRIIVALQKYEYLMKQLISRDFKTKYKRSVLGVLWSFLNPLLTMAVQYVVFSTLFKSDIPNFPLYLLSGIVCFNFFSEANAMSLQSIVGNASLITKVYVPKYIYPVSRVLSSGINLLLSMIPLFAVMLLTRTPIRPAMLLLPYGLLCLVVLCIGMGFLLSTAMVFFRDTQFLWSVLSMLWMYLTPIFYPESIIPARFLTLYHCNPLYHIIQFIRTIMIDGAAPELKEVGLCFLAAMIPLAIGAFVFKRNQDKFILNL